MKTRAIGVLLLMLTGFAAGAAEYPCRWVHFDQGLKSQALLAEFSNVVKRAAADGFNGVVVHDGIEHAAIGDEWRTKFVLAGKALCDSLGVEFIPLVWSLGYDNSGLCTWCDADSVEATKLVVNYVAKGRKAVFAPRALDQAPLRDFGDGKKSCAMTLPPNGHYRLKFEVKTEALLPDVYSKFRIFVFHSPRPDNTQDGLELYDPQVKPTQDFQAGSMDFTTYDETRIDLRGGKFGRVTGSLELRKVELVEVAPSRFLTTDGMAPVVKSAADGTVYEAGRDYLPVPKMKYVRPSDKAIELELPEGSRIRDGERLVVEGWIPAVEGNGQYSVCPSAPATYAFYRRTAKAIERLLHPKRWMLSMDEVRIMNHCKRCLDRHTDPAHLFADCITKQMTIIREVSPGAEILSWADMMAPTDNARGDYYVCNGTLEGSWNLVPKDLVQVVWENGRGPVALKHFAELGFRTLANCYYDRADAAENDRRWLEACNATPGCLGMMYFTYHRKYDDLGRFGEMLKQGSNPKGEMK